MPFPFPERAPTGYGYWVATGRLVKPPPAAIAFKAWLREEIGRTAAAFAAD